MGEYEVDGQSCWFVAQERMTKGVEENEFLDIGKIKKIPRVSSKT